MQRCLELALKGQGFVAPNPMVGAVLVYNNTIIGEGWHQQYGQAHAEVNCIANVTKENKQYIASSVLYVSLEPCSHYGKTPPCTNLIIENKIKTVVIGCKDANKNVDGVTLLQQAGVNVIINVLEHECKNLNKRFFSFHEETKPYVILKWAQTKTGFIANEDKSRILITNEEANAMVHKWRSEEAAIMVGYNTAIMDNPQLNVRNWQGKNPTRVVIGDETKLPLSLNIFNNNAQTIILNLNNPIQILQTLYKENIISVLIEGGTKLLQSFINANLWNEARVITNTTLTQKTGYGAAVLSAHQITKTETIGNNQINYCINKNNNE